MRNKNLNIKKILKQSWEMLMDNFFFLFIILIIILGFDMASSYFLDFLKDYSAPLLLRLSALLILSLVDILLYLGTIKISLDLLQGKKPQLDDLFSCYNKLMRQVVAEILYFFIVLGGLLLFIIPGFIWIIKYQFMVYFIVDKDMQATEALKASGKLTKGYKWNIFFYDIIIGLLNILGVLLFGVGLFFTLPISILALSKIYKNLLSIQKEKIF